MANRRGLQALTRQASAFLSKNPSLQSLAVPPTFPNPPLNTLTSTFFDILTDTRPATRYAQWSHSRYFSSGTRDHDNNKGVEAEDDSEVDDEEEEVGESSDYEDVPESSGATVKREYTAEEKEAEAEAIGYKVIGPLGENEQVFKPYEPVFAVVQIGSHQFKVSNRDSIFTERLKFCEVNDKLILNKVLLLGSQSKTIVGRPILPDAAVHAVVEEHALDAKVIIFKKKRRKNYRRTKGHRQELTKLRITDIQGIEKPEKIVNEVPSNAAKKKQEKVAVPA
ncbi:hypothetical protein QN277_020235 [Acacia crassicarpa]|uniref:Large ribosomal subunit protein bL21m n=1 Tax=Acacia crassicarpa TaxID=499986 RepID=A0AAE1JJ42_9FABA|nr:hypothetical protein QN277_020235 [Acacia crassicarpa]